MANNRHIQFEYVVGRLLDTDTISRGVNKYIERYVYIIERLGTSLDDLHPKNKRVKELWEEIKKKQLERGITIYIEDVYLSKGIKLMFQLGNHIFARHLSNKERKQVIINEMNEYLNSRGDPDELFDYLFMFFLLKEENQLKRFNDRTDENKKE